MTSAANIIGVALLLCVVVEVSCMSIVCGHGDCPVTAGTLHILYPY